MKHSKFLLAIDTLIKLSVVVALIIAAMTRQQYSYYTFLRWLVMIVFIYFAYKSFNKKQFGFLIFFGAVAVLFNPFHKFWFQRETWHLIDYIIAAITAFTIIVDWTRKNTDNLTQ